MVSENFEEISKKDERIVKRSTYNILIITIIITIGIAAFFAGAYLTNLNSDQISQEEFENEIAKLELKILENQLPTKQPSIPLKISTDNDPVIGKLNAPVTIIEFSDFQCPFCAKFHLETLPLIMNEYINEGQVKLVFRDFPIQSIHPNALPASLAAECANEQGKFKEMHDVLFENQKEWNKQSIDNVIITFNQYASGMGLDGNTFDSSAVQFVINPYDEFGLTKAMKIKEESSAKVIIITVGDISVEPVMRKALAIGADEAVRINMTAKDSYSTAAEIANYISNNSADLIITGKESSDYNGGAVGGMVAEMLNLPFINSCNGLDISGDSAKITREIDGGKETITSDLPLVIGGQKGLVEESELLIPNMRGIMQARTKPLSVIEPIKNEILTSSISFEKPAEKGACKLVDADNVSDLVAMLQDEAKVI